jgi:hypothetical protein
MGGAGDLLALSLNVPPWEELHELSRDELRLTNLVTTDAVAEVLPSKGGSAMQSVADVIKPVQDRFAATAVSDEKAAPVAKSTRTAEVLTPAAGVAATPPQ